MEAMYGSGVEEPHIFGVACSMLYLGNLFFRLGHNVVFGFMSSRMRAILAMTSMMLSMWTIFSIFVWFRDPKYIWMVFIGYGLGGLAIGKRISLSFPPKSHKVDRNVRVQHSVDYHSFGEGYEALGYHCHPCWYQRRQHWRVPPLRSLGMASREP